MRSQTASNKVVDAGSFRGDRATDGVYHIGALEFTFDGCGLRYIRCSGMEVVRRVFVAVRDTAWGTIAPSVRNVRVADCVDGFRIDLDAEHVWGGVDFAWTGTIIGRGEVVDGCLQSSLRFEMQGKARRTFHTNRTGLCLLHPIAECAGRACEVVHTDGGRRGSIFPRNVSPETLFSDVRALTYQAGEGTRVSITFAGEAFETEDQRNWADGSYKTYARPLSRPFPYVLNAGQTVHQSITIEVESATGERVVDPSATDDVPVLLLGRATSRLPAMGVSLPSSLTPSKAELDLLRAAGLSHLRAEIAPADSGFSAALDALCSASQESGLPLELGLHLPATPINELNLLTVAWPTDPPPSVARWIVYETGQPMPSALTFSTARERLKALTPGVPVGAGTIGGFAELNRNRRETARADGIAFAVNPQVHGTDDATIVESIESLPWIVDTARTFAPHSPLWVGPVTFHHRPDPFAAGNNGRALAEPAARDSRLQSGLGAAWATACLASLARTGVEAVTMFDAAGPFGVTAAGSLTPVYHALAGLKGFVGGEVLSCHGLNALSHAAFAVRKGNRLRLVVASLRTTRTRLRLSGLADWRFSRRLDLSLTARDDVGESSRSTVDSAPASLPSDLLLEAYAVVAIDFACGEGEA